MLNSSEAKQQIFEHYVKLARYFAYLSDAEKDPEIQSVLMSLAVEYDQKSIIYHPNYEQLKFDL